ncbi:asparaginase [Candidatus Saccharibacteria bacterium]|nr:asparaginase [Candidatus Saccharibacteria bacterium]
MVHSKYTTLHLNALLKYIPVGSFSIVAYVLAVYYFYPAIGIYWGTLVAYLIATVPIGILYYVQSNEIIKKLRGFFGMADKSTIHFIMTGGTIDFHYERRMDTVVPNKKSVIPEFVGSLDFVSAEYTELFIKDSRNLTKSDYKKILAAVEKSPYDKIIVTTGTFKIDSFAKYLGENLNNDSKTIVLTGSTTPISGFTPSEGLFNLGHSVASVQNLEAGIYISFNGELFSSKDIARLLKEGGLASIFQAGINSPVV